MAKSKLPTDWRERPLDAWNSSTFRLYLQDTHLERLGIPYVARSIKVEAGMLSNAIKQYGKEALKEFIDACFREYKPSPQYPSINFAFMYSYLRDRNLPKVLAELARKERMAIAKVNEMSAEEIENWL